VECFIINISKIINTPLYLFIANTGIFPARAAKMQKSVTVLEKEKRDLKKNENENNYD
jgi:hypothetical protein